MTVTFIEQHENRCVVRTVICKYKPCHALLPISITPELYVLNIHRIVSVKYFSKHLTM